MNKGFVQPGIALATGFLVWNMLTFAASSEPQHRFVHKGSDYKRIGSDDKQEETKLSEHTHTGTPYARFTADGELIRPELYREWIYIGTPITPNDMNGGKAAFPEFHNVYIDPESYHHYLKTGTFKDGTILVKELVSVGSKKAVSGNGYFMGEFIGLEAEVKDSKRFSDEPGEWAFFSFSDSKEKRSAKKNETISCNACHQGNAAEDWVFTQYYPVLRAARPK